MHLKRVYIFLSSSEQPKIIVVLEKKNLFFLGFKEFLAPTFGFPILFPASQLSKLCYTIAEKLYD